MTQITCELTRVCGCAAKWLGSSTGWQGGHPGVAGSFRPGMGDPPQLYALNRG